MTTALDLICDAAENLGIINPLEALSSNEIAGGLRRLNEMLESWSNESLSVYQILNENFATVAGTASYTIGSGATWSTTRPLRIESAFIRLSSIDHPVRIYTREEYDAVAAKTTSYMPEGLFYDPAVANAVIYLYGVPDAVYTVYLNSLKQLQSFAAVTTAVVLPPGYIRAIKANLAVELAPAFNRQPSQAVIALAAKSLANIKRLNSRTPKLGLGHLLGGSTGSDMAAFTAGY